MEPDALEGTGQIVILGSVSGLAEGLGEGNRGLAGGAETGDGVAQFLRHREARRTAAKAHEESLDPRVRRRGLERVHRIAQDDRGPQGGAGQRVVGPDLDQTLTGVEGQHHGVR